MSMEWKRKTENQNKKIKIKKDEIIVFALFILILVRQHIVSA